MKQQEQNRQTEEDANRIVETLKQAAHEEKIPHLLRFFKTGPGQYAEGDLFIGLNNPEVRAFVKSYRTLSLEIVQRLVPSPFHEIRLFALLILVAQYKKADADKKETIYHLYLKNTRYINNWDLVDLSAPEIVGEHLLNHDRKILTKLSKSHSLWEQRIAIISTLTLVRHKMFSDSFTLIEQMMQHPHDLIHKACGWTLREIGKRDREALSEFLMRWKDVMPRTMLRYAIEHYPKEERDVWLGRTSNAIPQSPSPEHFITKT